MCAIVYRFSLHPGDLYPFTRKPLFVIVDSDNSSAFQHWSNLFGQPLACLLSPEIVPTTLQGECCKAALERQQGEIVTVFLF